MDGPDFGHNYPSPSTAALGANSMQKNGQGRQPVPAPRRLVPTLPLLLHGRLPRAAPAVSRYLPS